MKSLSSSLSNDEKFDRCNLQFSRYSEFCRFFQIQILHSVTHSRFSLNFTMRNSRKAEPSNDVVSSERRNWSNIFKSLVQMVRSQQNQLHSFASRHKFLEDRLRMQHEGWVSDVRCHKDQISQVIVLFLSFRVSLKFKIKVGFFCTYFINAFIATVCVDEWDVDV